MHPTQIYINQDQLFSNLQAIHKKIGTKVKLCLPIKANAYGHGLLPIAHATEPLVDYFGVACLDEGCELRTHGIKKPILVFGAFDEEQIPGLLKHGLEITISSFYKAELLAKVCEQLDLMCKVHIKIDTGMNRIGVRAESALKLIDFILENPFLELTGLYSHLACSDEPEYHLNNEQIIQFRALVNYTKAKKPEVICHLANSGGVCYFPESYFDMVRPGILSYGYFPNATIIPDFFQEIKPCFSLVTRVSYFKVVLAGNGISYNHKYITRENTRVITLPIGYGDGYRRGLSNIGHVIANGNKYTISGLICMDMLMVDIGHDGEAYVGDEVVLIGKQGHHEILIETLAKQLDTNIYEILVGFNERIPRVLI